jgi:hypothetical protein
VRRSRHASRAARRALLWTATRGRPRSAPSTASGRARPGSRGSRLFHADSSERALGYAREESGGSGLAARAPIGIASRRNRACRAPRLPGPGEGRDHAALCCGPPGP